MPRATGKDHARINLDIWGDDDWLDLTPRAQHLYFVLWTSPQLSYCGTGDWHPGKIASKANGWTVAAVEAAAAELSERLFLIIDTDTGEFLLRSWAKHDGLWRTPNMAVSMANARAELASRPLRGVVVFEALKLKDREPDSSSWTRDAVAKMLEQKPIDPASLPPFNPAPNPGANPSPNPAPNPSPNPGANGYANPGANPPANPTANPWPNPSPNPSPNPPTTRDPNPSPNPPANPGPTPAPAPTSCSNLQRGYVTGERHQGTPNEPPPDRCPKHHGDPSPPPCGACADARRRRDEFDAERKRAADQAAIDERRQANADRLAAIAACELCDEDGYRGGRVCAHVDYADTARAGAALVRQALGSSAAKQTSGADA